MHNSQLPFTVLVGSLDLTSLSSIIININIVTMQRQRLEHC